MKTKTTLISKDALLQYKYLIPSLAFSIPFFVSGPQLLTGTAVNTLLILSTQKLTEKQWTILTVVPSIAAVLNGALFGKFTPFLLYLMPFIWIGNYVMMKGFVEIKKRTSYPIALFLSSALKTLILFLSVLLFFKLHLVPQSFIAAMSVFQFITAIIGGILAYFLLRMTTR